MMFLQTPKRPSLPPTPSSYNGGKPTSLPPLSSILNMTKDQFSGAASSTPFSVPSNNNHQYLPKLSSMDFTPSKPIHSTTYPRPYPMPTPIADTSDPDISITDMRRSVRSSAPAAMPPISRNTSVSGLPAPASHPQVAPTAAGAKDSKSFAFISHSPSTFPSQEPAIDNAPLARRKRRRTSPNELSILNTEFEAGSTPNKLRRIEIAAKVCMTEKAVQIWFQNKRQSLRKQSSHEKEITELPPTPPIIILQQRQAPAPTPMPLPLVSSTPTKPIMQKAHSFMGSPSVALHPSASTSSPIKERSRSIPLFKSEDADSSIDDSMMANTTGLVLNKTRKKQPVSLNSNNTSTMTFKLAPSTHTTSNTTNKINQRLTIAATTDDGSNSNKENSSNIKPITAAKSDRKPLSQINTNSTSTTTESTKSAVVENLLSLRTGNWA